MYYIVISILFIIFDVRPILFCPFFLGLPQSYGPKGWPKQEGPDLICQP